MNKAVIKVAVIGALLASIQVSFAETELTDEQQQLLDQTYQNAQTKPAESIQNAPGLSDEQKQELQAAMDEGNENAPGACGTILCIAGMMKGGGGGGECDSYVEDYFSIRKYRKGDFSPSRTAKARGSFLDKCPSPENKGNAKAINSAFGGVYASPF